MSDLFKYIYNECANNNKKHNTLCNYLYGDYIDEDTDPSDSNVMIYKKQFFYEKLSPEVLYFDDRHGHIEAYYYKNNNTIIKYCYHKKSLYVYSVHYENSANYIYLTMYIFKNVYHRGIPYNIERYSSKMDKYIFMNTKTKRYIITN